MKKIRIILCFCLMLSLCFGGCGNPAQNSSGDSSEKDSSKQEESSQKEDSKTEVSSKEENSSKAEESSKPGESSKVEDSSKAEVSSKPEESSVSAQNSKAEESSLKEESSQLEESSQAEASSTPEESSPSADADWAAAYLEAIEELTAEYGEGRVENGCFAGLVLVQLIDFDGDGQDELYCAGAPGENMRVDGYVYSYDGASSQFLASIGVGSRNTIPLSVHKKKDGITYIMVTDGGTQAYLFTLKDGSFIKTDKFTETSWNDESMTPGEIQEKIDSYETILYVDYGTPDQYDGPNLLADTQKTIEYLQELAE